VIVFLKKQREGQVGTIHFKYNDSITAIYDWDDYGYLKTEPYNPNKNIEPDKLFEL